MRALLLFSGLSVASAAVIAQVGDTAPPVPPATAQVPPSATDAAAPRAEDLDRLLADYAAARTAFDAARPPPGPAPGADPLRECLPKLRDLASRARGTDLACRAWIALAEIAGLGAVRETPGAAAACDEALGTLRTQFLDDPRVVAFVDRIGRDAATRLGFERGLEFLDRLRASARSADLKSAATLALARSWLDNADGLPEPRFEEAKALLRAQAGAPSADQADTRWARGARGTLFALEHLQIQRVVPDLHGVDSRGTSFSLGEFRGRVLVIDFFRADEPECRAALALRKAWVERFRAKPFTLLTIDGGGDVESDAATADERALLLLHGRPDAEVLAILPESARAAFARITARDAAAARARCEPLGITWRVAVDGDRDGPWARRFDVRRRPATWIVDAVGRIRYRDLPPDEIDVALAALVAEAERAPPK